MTGRLRRWCWKWLGLGKLEWRVGECEKGIAECGRELEEEEGSEHGKLRRRRMWLAELEKQGLTAEERREWESGM